MQTDKYTYSANAKINLGLTIKDKRSDGYHEIDTLMQSISLCDILYFRKSAFISVSVNQDDIPQGSDNIVYKAIRALENFTEKKLPLCVEIEKNIPAMAGLGGGSADAAAALIAANEIFALGLSLTSLGAVAGLIGSDVPFMLTGGLARCTGRGEIISRLKPVINAEILIIKPEASVSTKAAYDFFDNNKAQHFKNDFNSAYRLFEKGSYDKLDGLLGNDFERATPKDMGIAEIKHRLISCGAAYASLSGSGSAVYGIFDSKAKAQSAQQKLSAHYPFCENTCCCDTAVKLL